MEYSEFDRLIKEKIEGGKLLHEKEAERSKLYVWRRIQESLGSSSSRNRWYYLAAACILLLIAFGIGNYQYSGINYRSEFSELRKELEGLKESQQEQTKILLAKEREVQELQSEIDTLSKELNSSTKLAESQNQIVRTIYQRDTVYLQRVEYIEVPKDSTEIFEIEESNESIVEEIKGKQKDKEQDEALIFPSYSGQGKKDKQETSMTIKLTTF